MKACAGGKGGVEGLGEGQDTGTGVSEGSSGPWRSGVNLSLVYMNETFPVMHTWCMLLETASVCGHVCPVLCFPLGMHALLVPTGYSACWECTDVCESRYVSMWMGVTVCVPMCRSYYAYGGLRSS